MSLLGEKSTIGMQCHTLQENCILLALLLLYYSLCAQKGEKRVAFISSSMMDGALLNQAKKLSTTVKWNFLKRKKEERSRRRRKNWFQNLGKILEKALQNLLHPKYIFQFICLCWVVFSVVQCTAKNVYIYFLRNSVVVCFPGVLFSRLE